MSKSDRQAERQAELRTMARRNGARMRSAERYTAKRRRRAVAGGVVAVLGLAAVVVYLVVR